jgi:hypothetical protein
MSAPKPLSAYKRDAARLLKAARSEDGFARAEAAQRFARLASLRDDIQLKHALAVVALEAGFPNWAELKQATDQTFDFSEFFGAPGLADSINHWFTTYDEAKAHQTANGGVLLPYRTHYFVTSLAILNRLGYEPGHPDWEDIGHDFVRPASSEAHSRIQAALERRFGQKSQ